MRWVLAAIALALALPAAARALDPAAFATISSGVVKIKATGCKGGGTSWGSGFLVGTSVVVTADHVVNDCRRAQVLVKNRSWIPVKSSITWHDKNKDLDVATLKLAAPARNAWLFSFRTSQARPGAFIAVLGYPLAQGVSYTNGRLVARSGRLLLLKVLAAQGYSGGPVVDADGRVIGLVNLGAGEPGKLTGAVTGDNVVGYDFSSRWAAWRQSLCHAYPSGGIDDC